MANIIDGKAISTQIKDEVKAEAVALKAKGVEPCLAVVLVGEDPASQVYVRNKKRACEYCGFKSLNYELPASTTEEELLALIDKLNADKECNGILVQLPLPKHIDENKVLLRILPEKDVDGISSAALGKLFSGDKHAFAPCTAQAVMEILHFYGIEPQGKRAVVLGRSLVVGKPLSMLLLNENATVTICHSRTASLPEVCREADILVTAIGKAKWVDERFVSEKTIVIDVGINVDENGMLCGDVNFGQIEDKVSMATPVPGGVGAVTTAVLAKHVLEAAKGRRALNSKGGKNGLSAD